MSLLERVVAFLVVVMIVVAIWAVLGGLDRRVTRLEVIINGVFSGGNKVEPK